MKSKIVVIGSSNVDMIMKVNHIPEVGETLIGGEFNQVFGGKGANQAVSAARAGGSVSFISSVGDDVFTSPMLKNFSNDGINTKYVFKEATRPCGTALIMIGDHGENLITVAPGANEMLSPGHLETASRFVKSSEIIILQNEIPDETVEYAIEMAKANDLKVLWNFAPAREIDKRFLALVDYLVLNEVEAGFLTGMKIDSLIMAKKAARELRDSGANTLIITLGSEGSLVFDADRMVHIPALKVDVIDTTAAGDVFCGSLAVAITEKKGLEEAVKFATAASALSVTKMGAQPSAPNRKEIDNFINTLKN